MQVRQIDTVFIFVKPWEPSKELGISAKLWYFFPVRSNLQVFIGVKHDLDICQVTKSDLIVSDQNMRPLGWI